ncbi:MAG TPA: polyprenol monophosphomannose synthase [Terriglobales bacterium]|nr:polyprenol monophosphomannose synthase [Terriglobales bacterium]
MNSMQKLGLVIPTLNEAGNVEVLLQRAQASLDPLGIDYEIIVVDDDSRDGTGEVVQNYARGNHRVKLLVRRGQRGLAGAVIYGWQNTDADLLGVMDADLQHPPELLPKLVAAIEEGNDIAIGSRYAQEDSNSVAGWNPLRRLVSTLGTWVTVPLLKRTVRVKDPLSGFFVVRRNSVAGIPLQPEGFKILLEILVRGRVRSAAEVPFRFGLRYAGKSKASMKVALDYFSLLGRLSVNAFLKLGS